MSTLRSFLLDFKEKLSEIVARLSIAERLLLLIFAYRDEEPKTIYLGWRG